jgi:hypothetical protein
VARRKPKNTSRKGDAALEAEISSIDERLRVSMETAQNVHDLIRLAKTGHQFPVTTLFMLTGEMVGALNSIADSQPELLFPLSCNVFVWPAFISRKREYRRANEKLMSDLRLGEDGIYGKKKWQVSALSTQGALGFLFNAMLRQEVLSLPPLTKATKRAWFEASWNDCLARGIRPEEGKLRPLGEAAIKPKRAIMHANLRGMPEQTEAMKRDDMRAEIKRQVWKAFNSLVAG